MRKGAEGVTWESSYLAACVWEWILVTSAAAWPVQTDRSDCASTAGRLFLQQEGEQRQKIEILQSPEHWLAVQSGLFQMRKRTV